MRVEYNEEGSNEARGSEEGMKIGKCRGCQGVSTSIGRFLQFRREGAFGPGLLNKKASGHKGGLKKV
jgi:hypothetical protein